MEGSPQSTVGCGRGDYRTPYSQVQLVSSDIPITRDPLGPETPRGCPESGPSTRDVIGQGGKGGGARAREVDGIFGGESGSAGPVRGYLGNDGSG